MGRVDSTEQLKPHEIALRQLCMDADHCDLIEALLGLNGQSLEQFTHLLTNGKVKQLDDVCNHFTPDDLAKLPFVEQDNNAKHVEGHWIKGDELFAIDDSSDYAQKLNDSVCGIYPDFLGCEDTIPVTLLLPSSVQQDVMKLEGSASSWKFITVENFHFKPQKLSVFADTTTEKAKANRLKEQAESTLALRLYFAFKVLGLVDTQQSARNGSRIFLDLLRALDLSDQLNLLESTQLKAWTKTQKERLKLEEQFHTQEVRDRTLDDHSNSESSATRARKKKRRDEIHAKMFSIEQQIQQLDLKKPAPASPETKKALYYTIPDALFERLGWYGEDDKHSINFPTLKLKKPTDLMFTTVCLGSPKKNDPTALLRDADKMRLMLCYLCSMTSGTAITFNVKRSAYRVDRKTMGITSPTLILPEVWSDLAKGLKQHNSNSEVQAMSDGDYRSDGLRSDFVSAIHGDYLTKQDELLRLLPTEGIW